MNRSHIAACFLALIPFTASCALSEEELATEAAEAGEAEEILVDEAAQPPRQELFGADACTGTDIYITNSRTRNGVNTTIEVRRVEFYSDSENDWIGEDLADRILNFGTQEIWWDQNLARAENDWIIKWRVYYRYVTNGSWSSVVYQEIDTPNVQCDAGDNFYLTVE